MERVIHRAASRGVVDHGWLRTYCTFSYGNYYDPRRIHFGVLRVINDDTVEGGEGYSSRPNDNMEIIHLPLKGAFEHGDNLGNITVAGTGDIQVQTAGTGLTHNEYNKSRTDAANILNIWVYPREYDIQPRYCKVRLSESVRNEFRLIAGPDTEDNGPYVAHMAQDAWFYTGEFDEGFKASYTLHTDKNGVYIFVLEGTIAVGDVNFGPRDGVGLWDTASVPFTALSPAKVLLMEVPMKLCRSEED